jgi:hypothetical protein
LDRQRFWVLWSPALEVGSVRWCRGGLLEAQLSGATLSLESENRLLSPTRSYTPSFPSANPRQIRVLYAD